MKIAFVSNYFNHHQSFIAREFDSLTNHDFRFIETMPMEQERKNMGWGNENKPDYVLQSYLSAEAMTQCQQIINDADVVIWGSCPFKMIRPRLNKKKLTFMYSERLFKNKSVIRNLLRAVKYNLKLRAYMSNHYLLCASGYAKEDYNRIGLFKGKTFQWGYFPEAKAYENIDGIISDKESKTILWVARFIDWKHPKIAVELARHLKEKDCEFKLNMIGAGPLLEDVKRQIAADDLTQYVHIWGAMSPQEVRHHMEKSDIFIFTSDRNEGWGAVLNEAMNSACAVVANGQIGSVPFLIRDGENGFIYDEENADAFFAQVELLLKESNRFDDLKRNAYFTIRSKWNSSTAAKNFIEIASAFLSSSPIPVLENQPCAKF